MLREKRVTTALLLLIHPLSIKTEAVAVNPTLVSVSVSVSVCLFLSIYLIERQREKWLFRRAIPRNLTRSVRTAAAAVCGFGVVLSELSSNSSAHQRSATGDDDRGSPSSDNDNDNDSCRRSDSGSWSRNGSGGRRVIASPMHSANGAKDDEPYTATTAAMTTAAAAPAATTKSQEKTFVERRAAAPKERRRPGAKPVVGEPVYTLEEVAQADGTEGRPMWITYRGGVYDVTEFQHIHPGGHLIGQAAGADVGPFWDVWAHHHHAPKVGQYLDQLRIGALASGGGEGAHDAAMVEEEEEEEEEEEVVDPYSSEPVRDRDLQTVFTERPYCSETPNEALGASYLTAANAFYVRNHAPVPDCAWPADGQSRESGAEAHDVLFDGVEKGDACDGPLATTMVSLTAAKLEELFLRVTITSILQCAGNRASEDIAATGDSGFTNTPYENITHGMVGNAQWSGVRLAHVLPALYPTACQAALEGDEEWHIVFEGADGYSASTPLARVLRTENDCVLATRMNGEPLSPDHGYPMRAVLPGVAGARNVKWLETVRLQRVPVDAPWNSYYYKDARAGQIQELPMQSLILSAKLQGSEIALSGIAYGGGSGNAIKVVEISTDGGETWAVATLQNNETELDDSQSHYGWTRWAATVPHRNSAEASDPRSVTVCCTATDAAGNRQSKVSPKQRGYLFNGWHMVEVVLPGEVSEQQR